MKRIACGTFLLPDRKPIDAELYRAWLHGFEQLNTWYPKQFKQLVTLAKENQAIPADFLPSKARYAVPVMFGEKTLLDEDGRLNEIARRVLLNSLVRSRGNPNALIDQRPFEAKTEESNRLEKTLEFEEESTSPIGIKRALKFIQEKDPGAYRLLLSYVDPSNERNEKEISRLRTIPSLEYLFDENGRLYPHIRQAIVDICADLQTPVSTN